MKNILKKEKLKTKKIIITNKYIIPAKYVFCFFVESTKLINTSSKFVLMLIL